MGSQVHTIHELAIKIFDAIYDDEDLVELERKKVIIQPEGFKLSTVATMECELEDYIDRLAQENHRLREALDGLCEAFYSEYSSGALTYNQDVEMVNTLELLTELQGGEDD